MNTQSTAILPQMQTLVTCKLRFREPAGDRPGRPLPRNAAEVVLENVSTEIVRIRVDLHPLQYLNLEVTSEDGRPLNEHHYGAIFSPIEQPFEWQLRPGEIYTHPVSLLATLPESEKQPGVYWVRATYEVSGWQATSNTLRVEVPS